MEEQYVEQLIIKRALENKAFVELVVDVFESRYFNIPAHKNIFEIILNHFKNYNDMPQEQVIIHSTPSPYRDELTDAIQLLKGIDYDYQLNQEHFLEEVEKFLKYSAQKIHTLEVVSILEKNNGIDFNKVIDRQKQVANKTIFIDKDNNMTDASVLMQTQYANQNWLIDEYLPEGFTILAGKPKIGKSFLALTLSLCVAHGARAMGIDKTTNQGEVLFLALEDTERRLQKRLSNMNVDAPSSLKIATKWTRLGNGCCRALRNYIERHPETKLIVIDTFAKVKSSKSQGNRNIYDIDYESVAGLKAIADEYNITVLVLHHTRKQESDDPVELVSGSTGFTGAADTVMVLTRNRTKADGELYITGRDIDEQNLALEFKRGIWTVIGDAKEYKMSNHQISILELFKDELNKPMSPKEVSQILHIKYSSAKTAMYRMVDKEKLKKVSRGKYQIKNYQN